MLVTFTSSETGELMMFADVARTLLQAVGKETSRRGTFTRDEMLPAAQLLRAAAAAVDAVVTDENTEPLGPISFSPILSFAANRRDFPGCCHGLDVCVCGV